MNVPQIGQIGETLHVGQNETYWTEKTGMIIDKEFNPLTKDDTFTLIFPDGELVWTGSKFIKNPRWPE